MTTVLAIVAALAVSTQDPDVPADVRSMLQGPFGNHAAPKNIEACAERISAAIAAAKPAPWGRAVLKHLPEAVEYFKVTALRYSLLEPALDQIPREFRNPLPRVPPQLLQEGVHLQLDYLAAQVERVARTPWTDNRKTLVLEQIDRLAAALEAVLRSKLTGASGEAFASRKVEDLRRAWKASLDLPFSRLLDQPVSEAEFSRVVEGIRAAARPYAEVILSKEDLGNPERLAGLKVLSLVSGTREAAFKICAACFSEFKPFEERSRDWEAKAEKALGIPSQAPGEK